MKAIELQRALAELCEKYPASAEVEAGVLLLYAPTSSGWATALRASIQDGQIVIEAQPFGSQPDGAGK